MLHYTIGLSRGCNGCTCTPPPRAEKKWGGGKFTEKSCKCTPGRECIPRQSKSHIFLGNWGDLAGGRGYLDSLSVSVEATTKKVVDFFGEETFTPDKILATPMTYTLV